MIIDQTTSPILQMEWAVPYIVFIVYIFFLSHFLSLSLSLKERNAPECNGMQHDETAYSADIM